MSTAYRVAAVRMGRWWLPIERTEDSSSWDRYPSGDRYRQLHAALTAAVTALCGFAKNDEEKLMELAAGELFGMVLEIDDSLNGGKFGWPDNLITFLTLNINGWPARVIGLGDQGMDGVPLYRADRDNPKVHRIISSGQGAVYPEGITGDVTGAAIVIPKSYDEGYGTVSGSTLLTDTDKSWDANSWQLGEILIDGELRSVSSNTDNTITFTPAASNGNHDYEVWAQDIEADGTLLEAILKGAAARLQMGDPDANHHVGSLIDGADKALSSIAGVSIQTDWLEGLS